MTKQPKSQPADPHANAEAQRYEHPIPSRLAILEFLRAARAVLKFDDIADGLNLSEANDRFALDKRLNAMVRDGQLLLNRRSGYAVVAKLDLTRGIVIGHPDGFGFLRPDKGGDDLFLAPKQMRLALHGDEVLASISGLDRRGRAEGVIVEVLQRAHTRLLGRYMAKGRIGFVAPDNRKINQDVFIAEGLSMDASDGEMVLVEITEQPTSRSQVAGRVIEKLGATLKPDQLIDVAITAYGLSPEFPEEVIEASLKIPETVSEADLHGRFDLRDTELITIDGEDARDFDDAVFAEAKRGGGWRLVVAIADVSAYVAANDILDLEARARSTSVYFPKRVLPMLPERLSNGICSLNPSVERLCMVCDMSVSLEGKVTRSRFYAAAMRSHARLTYNRVWALLNKDAQPASDEKGWLMPRLNALYAMFQAMSKARDERGALDFEGREVKFLLGADGAIETIEPTTRNAAHQIIEECMIAANVEAAKFLAKHKMPVPYRVHAPPPAMKLLDVTEFLRELGLKLKIDSEGGITPKDFSDLLDRVHERPDGRLIEAVLLRAQSLAVYQTKNLGHFGLALKAYAHFTSPIRRYPDLMVHRGIRHVLNGGDASTYAFSAEDVEAIALNASARERTADEASRDVVERLKCVFMEQHLNAEFDGFVSGVTSFGLFVEIDRLQVQGLIHVTQLPNDYYHFDPLHRRLTGERRRQSYRLADRVRVQVIGVDADERKIDFKLAPDKRR